MGFTLDELKLLKKITEEWHFYDRKCSYSECIQAEAIVTRELRLKELERIIPKSDELEK